MAQAQPEISLSELDDAIEDGLTWLDDTQEDEGYWVGMLESNSCMEAEWLLAFHLIGYDHPRSADICQAILCKQRPDGAWDTFFDAPSGDINTTVEAYTALRLSGWSADAPELVRARGWIFDHGGLSNIRVFTRYWLALLGEWPWEHTPCVPPDIIRLPAWAPFNIYRFASWARATLLPISILCSFQFSRPMPAESRLDELFPEGRGRFDYALPRLHGRWTWERFFLGLDRVLHRLLDWQMIGRDAARRRCAEWIIRHQDADGAWGGIQPPWVYSLVALHALGYSLDHPVMARGLRALDTHWSYDRDQALFIQASESPIWDTLLALLAMQDSGRHWGEHPQMRSAINWLMTHECTTRGDWSVMVPDTEPGGWAFERANRHFPDIDDTAVALLALAPVVHSGERPDVTAAVERARRWVLAMQSDNGGWAAFDRNNHDLMVTRIPFCDFGEVLDPPSVDVTAHVVEALCRLGMTAEDPAIARALVYLWTEQEDNGSWFGRWGVNHIYGTAAVLPALAEAGENMQAPAVTRATEWLQSHQNEDGGWGETCASYMRPELVGTGPSTASQTAWAIMALLAANRRAHREHIDQGVRYLRNIQRAGTWQEKEYTGTGFPGYGFGARLTGDDQLAEQALKQGPELARAFMINYNLYRHYFPVMALARTRKWLARNDVY